MQHVLCTGNVCSKSTEEYLRTLANSVHIVRGDMDVQTGLSDLPEQKVLQIGEVRRQRRTAEQQCRSAACAPARRPS
jgi:vacuolar protein sorting-associated protein 29